MKFTTPHFLNIQLEGQLKRVAIGKGKNFKIVSRRKQYLSMSQGEMSRDIYETYYAPPKPVVAEEPTSPVEGEKEN
jgi:hypothetical protein